MDLFYAKKKRKKRKEQSNCFPFYSLIVFNSKLKVFFFLVMFTEGCTYNRFSRSLKKNTPCFICPKKFIYTILYSDCQVRVKGIFNLTNSICVCLHMSLLSICSVFMNIDCFITKRKKKTKS